jgi:predicted AlkP superfamily pyrophosphatase or phosphodiesterase
MKPPPLRRLLLWCALLTTTFLVPAATAVAERPPSAGGEADLNMVFVLDGLRPDSINPVDTPNLYRLRREGVSWTNSHSAVPTVTRVNSSVIGSGAYPANTGIVGNTMYVPAMGPSPFDTGQADNLTRLDELTGGRMLLTETLGERLTDAGKKVVAIGSGSSGGTLLLNPRAPRGNGVMINAGDVTPTRPFTYPTSVGDEILARFGPPPAGDEGGPNAKVDYTEEVLRDYVLTELEPDVVLNWFTQPDGSQHEFGAGSPEGLFTIRNDDRQIGLILDRLEELGLSERTNILVVSDHGFSLHDFNVNLTQELVDAGLKESSTSEDVVVANSGSSLVHVQNRDPGKIRAIVEFLQRQPWSGALYTAAARPRDGRYTPSPGRPRPDGWVRGTFSLELIHHDNAERGADIVVTYPWSNELNTFGVPGTSGNAGGGPTGPLTGPGSGHGSFSPWDVRNTFIAWGADVKDGRTIIKAPAGNVDIGPTLLALEGLRPDTPDGRVLTEAFTGGPDERRLKVRTRTFRTAADGGRYRAAVQISELDGQRYRYVDQSRRLP